MDMGLGDDSKVELDEEMDLMDALIILEDGLWDPSPLSNLILWEKMHCVTHAHMMELLTITKRSINDLSSTAYKHTYYNVFKALVVKKSTSKMSSSRASTPTVSNINNYMADKWDEPLLIPFRIKKEPQEEPIAPHQGNIMFLNLTVEDALTQINTPKQPKESDEEYHCQCAAAEHHNSVPLLKTPHQPELVPPETTDALTSGCENAQGTSESTGIHVPAEACVHLADNHRDHIVFQCLRNKDISQWGMSIYNDQGIILTAISLLMRWNECTFIPKDQIHHPTTQTTMEVVMILEMMVREIATLIGMQVHPLTWDKVEPLVATREEVATMDLQEEEEEESLSVLHLRLTWTVDMRELLICG